MERESVESGAGRPRRLSAEAGEALKDEVNSALAQAGYGPLRCFRQRGLADGKWRWHADAQRADAERGEGWIEGNGATESEALTHLLGKTAVGGGAR